MVRRPEETEEKFNDRYDRWFEHLGEVKGTAELLVAKQRHGPIGTVKLRFDPNTTKFENFIGDDRVPEPI